MEGFDHGRNLKKMGLKAQDTAELLFEDCRVPVENLLGREGTGFITAMKTFDASRPGVGAQALGIAQGAFDRTLTYTKKREQFGQKIAAMPVNSHKLADMAIKLELARLVTYKACWLFDQGRMDPMVSSMAIGSMRPW